MKLWEIETGEMLKSISFSYPVNFVKVLNQESIAVALHNGEIQIYDMKKHDKIKSINAHQTYVDQLYLL